ncbi:TetR/AcrR family transcriptional regulator [Collinsella vaginalis]|uniref:TetR/AcrR family transcriptional regulator n=1 Tax=Collinsella vaginalis TaxID=1870987 RepID=UPI000A271178|nr:TetR/AcrR family transcriptional regulator [Collinsella vaginalis]
MDLRIQKTYRALNSAFTELLSRSPYEKISVAALCDEAMIRRTTFYKHFRDKNDFFAFYIDSLRATILDLGPLPADRSERDFAAERHEILHRLTGILLRNGSLMDNILNSSMFGTMSSVICDAVADALRERNGIDPAENPQESSAAEFAAGGTVRLLLNWWGSEHAAETEDAFVEEASGLLGQIMEA